MPFRQDSFVGLDRQTLDVLAFRRTFMLAGNYFRQAEMANTPMLAGGEHCPQAANLPSGHERPDWLVLRTLTTIKPSTTLEYAYSKDGK